MSDTAGIDFATYIEGHLARRGWEVSDLAARAGLSPSVIHRWRKGYRPNLDNARLVAKALGVPILEVLLAAGQLTPDEAGATVAAPSPIAELTNAELLRELERRLARTEDTG